MIEEKQQKPVIELLVNILMTIGGGVLLDYCFRGIIRVFMTFALLLGDKGYL